MLPFHTLVGGGQIHSQSLSHNPQTPFALRSSLFQIRFLFSLTRGWGSLLDLQSIYLSIKDILFIFPICPHRDRLLSHLVRLIRRKHRISWCRNFDWFLSDCKFRNLENKGWVWFLIRLCLILP